MNEKLSAQDSIASGFVARNSFEEVIRAPRLKYVWECRDAAGNLKWTEETWNTVVTQGKNDILDKYFKGSAYTAAWFLGLKGTGSIVAGDTLASHAGWAEVNPYAGNRPAITWGTTAAGSNTATTVSYTINATQTVAGAFIASVNTGTSGILYSATDFAASRNVVSGDTLTGTPTVTV